MYAVVCSTIRICFKQKKREQDKATGNILDYKGITSYGYVYTQALYDHDMNKAASAIVVPARVGGSAA